MCWRVNLNELSLTFVILLQAHIHKYVWQEFLMYIIGGCTVYYRKLALLKHGGWSSFLGFYLDFQFMYTKTGQSGQLPYGTRHPRAPMAPKAPGSLYVSWFLIFWLIWQICLGICVEGQMKPHKALYWFSEPTRWFNEKKLQSSNPLLNRDRHLVGSKNGSQILTRLFGHH